MPEKCKQTKRILRGYSYLVDVHPLLHFQPATHFQTSRDRVYHQTHQFDYEVLMFLSKVSQICPSANMFLLDIKSSWCSFSVKIGRAMVPEELFH